MSLISIERDFARYIRVNEEKRQKIKTFIELVGYAGGCLLMGYLSLWILGGSL